MMEKLNASVFFDPERIEETGLHIRDQLHVRIGDAGEAANRGRVKELAVDKEVGVH